MRETYAIFKSLLIIAVLLLSSCVNYEEESDKQDTIPLTFYLQTSGGKQTRGYEGEEEAIGHEGDINTVEVWLYDGSTFVGYSNVLLNNNKIQINVPQAVVSRGSIDVYVIANGNSVGLGNLGSTISLETLQTKLLGGSNFLPTANGNNRTKEVPNAGLPFSQMLTGVEINSTGLQATLPTITLTRAVSKFRFAFARSTGMSGVAITGIELKESLIASNEYIFPKQDTETEKNYGAIGGATYYGDRLPNLQNAIYVGQSMLWGANTQTGTETAIIPASDINEVEYPERMTFDYLNRGGRTMTGPAYENYVTENFIKYMDNGTTRYHDSYLTYLRETDKPLEVTFYYRLSAEETKVHKTTITMAAANDFTRNHIWTVYAYFLGGGLYVVPIAQPWQWGGELNFFSKTTVQLSVDDEYNLYVDGSEEKKFKYLMYSPDEDGNGEPDYNNWDNNYCAIASGFDGHRPKYSPWLVLKTTSMSILQLQTDNTNFGFIVAEKTTEGENTYTYSSILDEVNIPAGKNVTTYFYVVPKGDFNLANPPSRFVDVTLIERNTTGSDEIFIHRLPWNSVLPGAQSHETAQFYYVTGTEYQQNIDGTNLTLSKQ